MAAVSISPRGEARLRHGHPWIYRSDAMPAALPLGDVVTVRGARDRARAGVLRDRSQIALRMSARRRPVDEAFWRARLEAAIGFRHARHRRHGLPARPRQADLLRRSSWTATAARDAGAVTGARSLLPVPRLLAKRPPPVSSTQSPCAAQRSRVARVGRARRLAGGRA
jgi:hypothetical protein